ncbi:MAG: response regulator [Clostridia bacterium]|nr:response regulator [Clostridia bacterium]
MNGDYQTTAMLSDIVGMIWLQAQEKGLEFRVAADPALPRALNGDAVRVKQVLLNVLTNAVKYTKAGSVTLTLGSRRENGQFLMTYRVDDTGIGIRPESIPDLFTAFQRMDAQKTHTIEGTGLGLSIVKQLLDLMGGTVQVMSEYGKGSTFLIEIPQAVADSAPIGEVDFRRRTSAAAAKQAAPEGIPALNVLAVDDTRMNLLVVKKLLQDSAARVDTALSGAEALEMTARTRYDVILMDHQMPEMDGIECLHRIRTQENGLCRDSKVICLTANVGSEIEQLCMKEGFDGFLTKPVRGEELIKAISRPAT